MADARPSPPKKRRTDNGPVTADAIAQANSTLQLFTGQRHNRWMQGHVPPSAAAPTAEIATSPKERVMNAGNFACSHYDISPFPEGNSVENPSTEGVTRNTNLEAHRVNYRQRDSSTSIINPESAAKSLESTARAAAQPGLPSPAASDENTISPIIGGAYPPKHLATAPPPSVNNPRVRPTSTNHAHPSTASAGSPPIGMHHVRRASQRQTHSRTASVSSRNANRPPTMQSSPVPSLPANHPGTTPLVPSQPFAPAQQSQYQAQDIYLSRTAMMQRFQEFQTHHAPRQKINGVDSGRLALLGEAIEKGDLFFIVLSQIHALTPTREFLPISAQGLDNSSWQYLDYLICSPNLISPPVLNWLQTFPAPILKIYFSTQSAAVYEPCVRHVVEFLRLLPRHWDRITLDSQNREAPPLVEDLYDILHLPSPVFHITAFRAIARLIVDSSRFASPEKGIDKLEVLFKMDQRWFASNGRRNPEEKSLAYRAFRNTKDAWKRHEERMQERERRLSNGQPPLPHMEFGWPPDVNLAFQHRVTLPSQLTPSGAVATTHPQYQAHQAPPQTQRAPSAGGAGQAMRTQPTVRQQSRVSQPRNGTATPKQAIAGSPFIFPREGEMPRAQPTNPDPTRSALHQAHLRSPTLGAAVLKHAGSRLYRHIVGWALSPKKLIKDNPVQTFSFGVPQENFGRIPITIPPDRPGERPSRSLTESSHTYRLRCAAHPPHGYPTEPSWVGAENYWPDDLYLEFNGVILEPRRKLHHNRYLPIDLTYHIKAGENKIKATINRVSNDPRPFEYVLAVEIVGVMSHESIKKQLRTVGAAETLEAIKKSLLSKTDDDDIAVTSSNLTIKLFDPYSHSKIFDTPVRGSACPHKDCFDLETFLSMCKRERPDWPTVVDCWRCPLCRGDVRPQTLIVDGFLQEVRDQLEKRGLLNTRAIVVEADGSWKPREEERTGVRSPSLEREDRERSERGVSAGEVKKKWPAEIIEID